MHHVDAVQVSRGAEKWIAAVDALGAAHPR
jgi:hypothetical protein